MTKEEFLTYLIEKLKQKFPALDCGPGSAIYDLILVPLVYLNEQFQLDIDTIFDRLNIDYYKDKEDVSELLDILAQNFLIKRSYGGKAIGKIKLFFDVRTDVSVSKGATFATIDGRLFFAIKDYIFLAMELIWEPPYYTCEIEVEAEDYGEKYNCEPNEIIYCYSGVSPTPNKVTNEQSITGGKKRESDKEFIERIKEEWPFPSVITTKKSLARFLTEDLGIDDFVIIDCNDPLMERDKVYELIRFPYGIFEKNYVGKISSLPIIINRNKAYHYTQYSDMFEKIILRESYHGYVTEEEPNVLKDDILPFIRNRDDDVKVGDYLALGGNIFLITNVSENAITASSNLIIGSNQYYLILRFGLNFFSLPSLEDFTKEFSDEEYLKIALYDQYKLEFKPKPLLILSCPSTTEEEFKKKWLLSECYLLPNQLIIGSIRWEPEGIILGYALNDEEAKDVENRIKPKKEFQE